MIKEELQKRLQLVEMDLQQTTANYNALLGAKSEINFWLAKLQMEESQKEQESVAVCDVNVCDVEPTEETEETEEAKDDACTGEVDCMNHGQDEQKVA